MAYARSTVISALRRIEADGLIEIIPNWGTFRVLADRLNGLVELRGPDIVPYAEALPFQSAILEADEILCAATSAPRVLGGCIHETVNMSAHHCGMVRWHDPVTGVWSSTESA